MYNPGVVTANPWPKRLILLLAISLIILNVIRIINVPITFDEAWTYVSYASSTWKNILICNPLTANNHILNSLLTKFFVALFNNDSLFILRLPNLLAQIAYLCFGYLLLQKVLRNEWWILAGFILLNFNPFLFNFLGLCRGYGIAISLMTAAIYFFLHYINTDKPINVFLSLLLMVMSTYSGFSMLNVYVAFIGVILARTIFLRTGNKKKYLLIEFIAIVFCSLLLYIMIVQPVVELKENGEFYYGGTNGFIADTVYSLARESLFYNDVNVIIKAVAYLVLAFTIAAGIYWFIRLKQTRVNNEYLKGTLLWLLLIIPALSTIVQHYLFSTLFLIERTAIFFYPLFIIQLLAFSANVKKQQKLLSACIISFTLLSVFNFCMNMNISAARTWQTEMHNELVIKRITEDRQEQVKIKVYWMFMPSFKYYSLKLYNISINAGNVGEGVHKQFGLVTYADTTYDYYYIHQDELAAVPPGYIEDTSFFDGKYVLLKKKD